MWKKQSIRRNFVFEASLRTISATIMVGLGQIPKGGQDIILVIERLPRPAWREQLAKQEIGITNRL